MLVLLENFVGLVLFIIFCCVFGKFGFDFDFVGLVVYVDGRK